MAHLMVGKFLAQGCSTPAEQAGITSCLILANKEPWYPSQRLLAGLVLRRVTSFSHWESALNGGRGTESHKLSSPTAAGKVRAGRI